MAPRKKNNPPRRRSAEAKALALKHFRQRKLPSKKPNVKPIIEDLSPDDWDWYDFEEGSDGC